MSERRDYYKITDLSENFDGRIKEMLREGSMQAQTEVQLWQAKFMLAIAQQLSVIASHLGKIVGKAEERIDKN